MLNEGYVLGKSYGIETSSTGLNLDRELSLLATINENAPNAYSSNSIDVKAAAAMCQFAYAYLNGRAKESVKLLDDWQPMSMDEMVKIERDLNLKFVRNISGFSSMLFVKCKDGKKKYAYCTKGTDMTSVKDWFSNLSQGLIGLSPQYTYSVQIARKLDRYFEHNVLWFIGHSLGGGLASNNALVTKSRHAITFNAAGLSFARVKMTLLLNNPGDLFHVKERNKRIHAFVLRNEILNFLLTPLFEGAYGNKQIIEPNKTKNVNWLERHALTNILKEQDIDLIDDKISRYFIGDFKPNDYKIV